MVEKTNVLLDEQTATLVCIAIHNNIEILKQWERKLRLPFMPTTNLHYATTPVYPKPTLHALINIRNISKHFTVELEKVIAQELEKEQV